MTDALLTVEDMAVRLSAQPDTVRKWARSGCIPGAFKPVGQEWRFRADVIEEWLGVRA